MKNDLVRGTSVMQSNPRIIPSKLAFWLSAVGLVGATALFAFPTMFSTLASYDDEGYVMMSLRTYIEGDRLYGKTYTQYGPAYYLITAPIHSWMGLPITHNVVRLKSIFFWIAISSIAFGTSYRLTRSGPFACAIGILCAIQLQKLSLEPGHPQELALIASMLVLFAMTFFPRIPNPASASTQSLVSYTSLKPIHSLPNESSWAFAIIAASFFSCIVGWTKLNCGLVVAIPVMACVTHYGILQSTHYGSKAANAVLKFFLFAVIALPGLAIIWNSKSDPYGFAWSISVTLAAILFVYRSFQCRTQAFATALKTFSSLHETPTDAISSKWESAETIVRAILPGLIAFSTALATSIFIVLMVWCDGVSLPELWYGVVGQHRNFSQHFYQPIRLQEWLRLESLIAIVGGIGSVLYLNRKKPIGNAIASGILLFAGAFIGLSIASVFHPIAHGLEPQLPSYLLAVFGPWIILVLMYLNQSENHDFAIDRFGIGLVGILSPWIAFPVAGTQVELGTIPSIIAISTGIWDVCLKRVSTSKDYPWRELPRWLKGLCCLALMLFTIGVSWRWINYRSATPLSFPGSSLIRLSQERAAEEEWVAAEILRVANSVSPPIRHLVFEGHTSNRFHFWTGLDPLTSINPTFWPRMITESQEAIILEAIKRVQNVCIVRTPEARLLVGECIPRVTNWIANRYCQVSPSDPTAVQNWQIGYLTESLSERPVGTK